MDMWQYMANRPGFGRMQSRQLIGEIY
jgi:hypothetical protein